MQRDLVKWKFWHDWHKAIEQAAFDKAKAKAIREAEAIEDENMRRGMLYKANKMRFLFDKSKLISYGQCLKFNKEVSFIRDSCQIETQHCFLHRKDYVEPIGG
jgi:hypothetical protein